MTRASDGDLQNAERLRQLSEKIDALKKANAPEPEPSATSQAAGGAELAWRMVIDLVAGIGIGFGIGYGLDWLFGTIPIFLVVFTLMGFAAGVQSMMRTAKAMAAQQAALEDASGQQPAVREDEARGD